MHYPSMPGPFPFGMPPSPHMFPPMYYQHPNHPNQPNYYPQQRPTIKKALDRFLMESSFGEKVMVRKTLYDLMVFVDKNYESINDPRAKNRIFLSYCDEFDQQFSMRLIHEHIGRLTQEKSQKSDDIVNSETEK